MDQHFGQAIYIKGHGEILVRFETLCGRRVKNPALVVERPLEVTCRGCQKKAQLILTNDTLRLLLWNEMPRVSAWQAPWIKEVT